jgi:ATP-dependent DNA ligase
VKLKIEFEIDLQITGIVEGSGKATGMMGALQLSSSCGKLVTDVGTGFSDILRQYFWMNRDALIGQIVTVKANDIISKRDRDTKSLFLPVWIEERQDKTVADSWEQCEAILASAKGLK